MRSIAYLLGFVLFVPALGFAEMRVITLEEALTLAAERSRDLRASRERLTQIEADVDRAWSVLLPMLSAQGRYTLNNKEVTVSFAPGPLQQLQQQFQKDVIADLYEQTGKSFGPKVQEDVAALQRFCQDNPDSTECSDDASITIQKRHQLDATVSALVPILVPHGYASVRAAREAYAAGRDTQRATEAQLLLSVASSFFAAAGSDELVNARRHAIQVARQTLDNARARHEAGVATRVEVTRAEQALVRAEQVLREAQDGAAAAYRALATLIQLRESFRVAVDDRAIEERIQRTAASPNLVSEGLKLRPELRSLSHQQASAEALVLSAKLRWTPTLSAFGLARAFNASGFAGDRYAWAVGLQLDWALFDGGLRLAQQKQSRAAASESALRLAQLRDQIADEVITAEQNLTTRRSAVDSARREVALADETLRLVRAQYDAGTATQLDLLQAQDALINAEVGLARSRFEYGLAAVQLERAAGRFP